MTDNHLTIGKIHGLTGTSTPNGAFAILAFDHRKSFVKMLNPEAPQNVPYQEVVAVKSTIVRVLSPYASAVLLDPVYSAAQTIANGSLPGTTGLLVAVEETGYGGTSTERVSELLSDWSVDKIKRMGADAVKLLIYYHPERCELTEQQERFTSQVIAACRKADIALFLEPLSYSIDPEVDKGSPAFASQRPDIITEIARRLGNLGPDVLKLEFPVDSNLEPDEAKWAEACEAVSIASPCPWAVLSAGVDFDTFARQVEIACKSGASGFIGGRAVWKEGISMPADEREAWLKKVASARLARLTEIANQYARPWREYYPDLAKAAPEGWYTSYGM
jgi:tagatose 1,6-diphosphate aldolase